MDRISDNGKKVPLLVVGEMTFLPPGARSAAVSALPADLNDFYVILSVAPAEVECALRELEARGLSPDQLLVHPSCETAWRHRHAAGFGLLERVEGESADELRARLFARIESQRQKKLPAVLREAHERGSLARLGEAELGRAVDSARIAHALACGYGLPPAAHARVLRTCLEGAPASLPWTGEPAPEKLLPEAAIFLVDAFLRGASARDAIREHAAGLTFRARTELLHQVEACLGPLLGGKHAA